MDEALSPEQSTASPATSGPAPSLAELLATLATAGVSSAKFSDAGQLLEVNFKHSWAMPETGINSPPDPMPERLDSTERAALRLLNRERP